MVINRHAEELGGTSPITDLRSPSEGRILSTGNLIRFIFSREEVLDQSQETEIAGKVEPRSSPGVSSRGMSEEVVRHVQAISCFLCLWQLCCQ